MSFSLPYHSFPFKTTHLFVRRLIEINWNIDSGIFTRLSLQCFLKADLYRFTVEMETVLVATPALTFLLVDRC